MSNFAEVGVLGASKFEQNILTSATVFSPAMFRSLLFRSGSAAEAANLSPPDEKIPETLIAHLLVASWLRHRRQY